MPPVQPERRHCARHQSICQSFKRAWKCSEITRRTPTTNCSIKRRERASRWRRIMTASGIVGQLLPFDQSLILAGLTPNQTHIHCSCPTIGHTKANRVQVKAALLPSSTLKRWHSLRNDSFQIPSKAFGEGKCTPGSPRHSRQSHTNAVRVFSPKICNSIEVPGMGDPR